MASRAKLSQLSKPEPSPPPKLAQQRKARPAKQRVTAYLFLSPGYNKQLLKEGLQLLAEVSWTTCGVEQGHGSVAVLHRLHPDYSLATLAARSMIHQTRSLFERPARALDKVASRLRRVANKAPEKSSGRHYFLGEAYAALKQVLVAQGQSMTNDLRLKVMREHAGIYRALPLAKRRRYEAAASDGAVKRRAALDEEVQHTLAALRIGRQRELEECLAAGSIKFLLTNVRFTDNDWGAAASAWGSSDFSMGRVMDLRAAATQAPQQPGASEKAALDAQGTPTSLSDGASRPLIAPWAHLVCHKREALHGFGVVGPVGGQTKAFALLYAKQNPLQAVFAPLASTLRTKPGLSQLSAKEQKGILEDFFQHEFEVELGRSVLDQDIKFDDDCEIKVIPNLAYLPGRRVVSHFDAVPLTAFKPPGGKAPAQKKEAAEATEDSPSIDPELLRMYPWLQRYEQTQRASSSKRGPGLLLPEETPDTPRQTDEELVVEAWAVMESRRSEWAEEGQAPPSTDFEAALRIGSTERANTGFGTYYHTLCKATTEAARVWVKTYGLKGSAAFSIQRYGHEGAPMLASAWCGKMQYLFNLYAGSTADVYTYHDHEVDAYEPEAEYAAWLEALPAESPARTRHADLTKMRPLRPAPTASKASSSKG